MDGHAEEADELVEVGSYTVPVSLVRDSSAEILILWAIQQPTLSKPNTLVSQASLQLNIDACGHHLCISQSPSSMSKPGVTGAVMWDSGVVLAKFLEHAVESSTLVLHSKKVVELGSGCGLVGCVAALLGAQVVLTDMFDRLKLLRKNVEANVADHGARGSATVHELVWGEDLDPDLTNPPPDYVLASDVIYSEGAVKDLLATLRQLCGMQTTILLSGELRNDAILEHFLDLAIKDFVVGRVDQEQWHPDYCSSRVMLLVLVRKPEQTSDQIF
ncbi:hypothetical protein Sjap_014424 [Stephania japonica]|uniref:Uncharacterized protein n=1 Tax=Stephania japonica TaxID=461633 RepID=A0AAP0NPY3_9MAGN